MTASKKQTLFQFQGKDQKEVMRNFFAENFITRLSEAKAVLKALSEDPFLGYEPLLQVAYNNPVISNIIAQRKALVLGR